MQLPAAVLAVHGVEFVILIDPRDYGRLDSTERRLGVARVVRLLNEQGLAGERLRAVSRGPFAPVASNDTPKGRARNRRTEIILRPVPPR